MQVRDFFSLINQGALSQNIVFHGKEYPALFLTALFHALKQRYPLVTIDAESCTLSAMKAQLSMSFLGNTYLYALKNISLLDAASKKEWHAFLGDYQGPHTILFFTTTAAASTFQSSGHERILVELPDKVERDLYRDLYTFFYAAEPDQYFLDKLFAHHPALSLDEACRIMSYQRAVGRKCDLFFKQWFGRLVVPHQSFYTLSQYFFALKPKDFLAQWKACKGDLPDEFWLAYWAEQLWQATLFVLRARSHGIAEAKKGAQKLPFSFINKDWQLHTSASLTRAHTALAQLDYQLKNGGSHGLELWYHRFLAHKKASF